MIDDVEITVPLVGVCEDDETLRLVLTRALAAAGLSWAPGGWRLSASPSRNLTR